MSAAAEFDADALHRNNEKLMELSQSADERVAVIACKEIFRRAYEPKMRRAVVVRNRNAAERNKDAVELAFPGARVLYFHYPLLGFQFDQIIMLASPQDDCECQWVIEQLEIKLSPAGEMVWLT